MFGTTSTEYMTYSEMDSMERMCLWRLIHAQYTASSPEVCMQWLSVIIDDMGDLGDCPESLMGLTTLVHACPLSPRLVYVLLNRAEPHYVGFLAQWAIRIDNVQLKRGLKGAIEIAAAEKSPDWKTITDNFEKLAHTKDEYQEIVTDIIKGRGG